MSGRDSDSDGDGLGGDRDSASLASNGSGTMRERQHAINTAHPFGIRLWKPALYRKTRSVEQNAEEDIHSGPNRHVPLVVRLGNLVWTLSFGLLLCGVLLLVWVPLLVLSLVSSDAKRYARVLLMLALFFLVPFGKYVQLCYNENYLTEDDGHGRPLSDYLAWENGEASMPSRLFFAPRRRRPTLTSIDAGMVRTRLFGRGQWSAARVVYYIWYYAVLVPVAGAVCCVCWLSVFGVPMARVCAHMLQHMRIHPLALSVERTQRFPNVDASQAERVGIVLCTYRAFGLKYYKYTVDGTNVVLLNLLFVVFLTLGDRWGPRLLPRAALFVLSLVSIVPLAHFIGQAVASISAQSSMSMGATINAFFSTIVEVYLYLVALRQGKGALVEGSVSGSVLAGVLLMPGLSMCTGAFYHKTQSFNPKSAGATSTMLLYTLVGVLGPTIFYAFYGPSQVTCTPESSLQSAAHSAAHSTAQLCWSRPAPLSANSLAYTQVVKPFSVLCAVLLFITYAVGLLFTLRTHAALIWSEQVVETGDEEEAGAGDAMWGRRRSYAILLSATVLYAMIAEVLVDSVDVVLAKFPISQRMLGLTVFALVPNTTEFLNAISFALYGNVSLSLEIGSAYALQVCLLQIPALVLLTVLNSSEALGDRLREFVFVLLFPKWDTWAWIFSMLLYCHVHSEGRSNYFKGAILLMAYTAIVVGFYFNDIISELPSGFPAMATLLHN